MNISNILDYLEDAATKYPDKLALIDDKTKHTYKQYIEKAKEIGIRMAIGAKASDIRLQFLIEALILSMAGGLIGIITGVVGAKIIEILLFNL